MQVQAEDRRAASLWFSAVWGYMQARTECVTPPTLATENWVIPSASWLVPDDLERQPSGNLPVGFKHDRDYSSPTQSNSVAWNWEIMTYFFVLFDPPTYIPPSPVPTLFFSLIFRSRGGSVFKAQAESLLSTCSQYVIENIQMD